MRSASILMLALSVALLGGCRWPADVARENVRLRHQVVELEGKVESARRERAELEAAIEELTAAIDPIERELPRARPAMTELAIGGLSHVRDLTGDGLPDALLLYITPRDGRGRFMQVVGEFTVQVTVVEPARDPQVIGERRFTPLEVREAYRTSFVGTHYTLDVPISLPQHADMSWRRERSASVTVWFHEHDTGRTFEQTRTIPLVREGRRR